MTQTTITTQQSLLVGRNVGIALVGALIWRSLARSIWGPDVDVTTPTICGGAMVLCLVQLWKQYSGDKSLCWSWSWVPGVERKCPGSRSIIQNDGTHMEQSFSKSTRGKEPFTLGQQLASDKRWDYMPNFQRLHKARYRKKEDQPGSGGTEGGHKRSDGIYRGRTKSQVQRLKQRHIQKQKTGQYNREDPRLSNNFNKRVATIPSDADNDDGKSNTAAANIGRCTTVSELLEEIGLSQFGPSFEKEELTSLQLLCRMKTRDTNAFERTLEKLNMEKIGQRERFIQALCDWESHARI